MGGLMVQVFARFISILAIVLAGLLGNAGTAAAANPLLCFDGHTEGTIYGGHCTLFVDGSGATLDNQETNANGNYSGVYYASSSVSGKPLSAVTELSFTYSGTPTAGSPRISLPIDADNNAATTEFFAFIGAFYCNDGAGHVDGVHDSSCTIFWTFGTTSGSDANWAAFVAAHPTWRVSSTASPDVPFVIADDRGVWTASNVRFEATTAGGGGRPPSDKDKCKKGGWMDLTRADGSSFKNQGDCIQYVNTGK